MFSSGQAKSEDGWGLPRGDRQQKAAEGMGNTGRNCDGLEPGSSQPRGCSWEQSEDDKVCLQMRKAGTGLDVRVWQPGAGAGQSLPPLP